MILKKAFLFMIFFTGTSFAQDLSVDKDKIEQIIGVKGKWFEEEGVLKLTFPRMDVKVVVDGRELSPFMGLSSWISFISVGESLMAMGDLVLFEDEVNPVMKTALDNGLGI